MDARVITGIAAGAVGVGAGIGGHLVMRHAAHEKRDLAAAEWNTWKSELDAEFPNQAPAGQKSDRPLHSDAEQARFEEFLAEHPAPKWLRIEHQNLRRISIEANEPNPKGADTKGLIMGLGGIAAGAVIGFGGALLAAKTGPGLLHNAGTAMNVAGAALGLTTLASWFLVPKDDVRPQIESTEWHTPHKWYH